MFEHASKSTNATIVRSTLTCVALELLEFRPRLPGRSSARGRAEPGATAFLSEKARADLGAAWLYIARESGSIDVATRVVESIYRRFWLLAEYPYSGRSRNEDLRIGLRTMPASNYIIVHRVEKDTNGDPHVVILRVIHSSRDLLAVLHEGSA